MDFGRCVGSANKHMDAGWPVATEVSDATSVSLPAPDPPAAKETWVIQAGMGMGKTEAMRARLAGLCPEKGAVVVCPRRTLVSATAAALGRAGFVAYNSDAAADGSVFCRQALRVVIQFESLHKVRALPHAVVVDEATSVAMNAASRTTNGRNIDDNLGTLIEMMRHCALLVVLDARVCATPVVRAMVVEAGRPAAGFRAVMYTHVSLPRVIVRWDSAKAMRAEMRRRIGEGRRLVIACGSRTAAVGIRDSVAKWRPQTTVQLYHGESDETVRSRDFADVNAQWTAQVVVFTSTCTVGVSYTVQDGGFDSVFLLVGPGGGYGPTALEYAQMTGRARHLHSREVHLVAPPSVDPLPRENASELVAAYVTEKYERHRGDRLLFARRASHDGGLTLTDGQPTLLMTAEAWRAVISRRTDVLPALLRILVDEDRGTWRWAVEQESPGPIRSSQQPPEKSVLKRVAKFINESSTKEIERRVADARLLAARSGRREEDICLQDAWSRLCHLREESWRTDDPADQVARLELAAVRPGTVSESAALLHLPRHQAPRLPAGRAQRRRPRRRRGRRGRRGRLRAAVQAQEARGQGQGQGQGRQPARHARRDLRGRGPRGRQPWPRPAHTRPRVVHRRRG